MTIFHSDNYIEFLKRVTPNLLENYHVPGLGGNQFYSMVRSNGCGKDSDFYAISDKDLSLKSEKTSAHGSKVF